MFPNPSGAIRCGICVTKCYSADSRISGDFLNRLADDSVTADDGAAFDGAVLLSRCNDPDRLPLRRRCGFVGSHRRQKVLVLSASGAISAARKASASPLEKSPTISSAATWKPLTRGDDVGLARGSAQRVALAAETAAISPAPLATTRRLPRRIAQVKIPRRLVSRARRPPRSTGKVHRLVSLRTCVA